MDLEQWDGLLKGIPGATHREQLETVLRLAKEQGFTIIPLERDGSKEYSIFKYTNTDNEVAFNPILPQGEDWIGGSQEVFASRGTWK